ncbi:MAG: Hpt domain-containing protein [Bacteroidales bacterium]
MENQLYNLTTLKEMIGNDPGEIREIIGMFVESAPSTLSEMQEAYAAKDYESLGNLAHRLKTNLRLMNIESLETPILIIEKNSKEKQDLVELSTMMEKLNKILPAAIEQIRENELS